MTICYESKTTCDILCGLYLVSNNCHCRCKVNNSIHLCLTPVITKTVGLPRHERVEYAVDIYINAGKSILQNIQISNDQKS